MIEAFALLRQRVKASSGKTLADFKEDEVTLALLGIIENDFRQNGRVAGFDRALFDEVTRQREVENYNFQKTQKKPDMLFKLRTDEEPPTVISTQHALFVECKPVDSGHPAGSDYCDCGLQRFIDGDYAWAMQDALMIGYVRDGRTIAGHLAPAMKFRSGLQTVSRPTRHPHPQTVANSETEALHFSVHQRLFPWPDGKGPACEITIYHSWHLC
ncbi:MAG: hypothetical protein H7343_24275 [Undibacterium sp.]|nr:hypothetical protein [Opitutaceae bacterium]